MSLNERERADLEATLLQMKRHGEDVRAQRAENARMIKQLKAYATHFGELLFCLELFVQPCAPEFEMGCRYCLARAAVDGAHEAIKTSKEEA